jgi:hypothetical protein
MTLINISYYYERFFGKYIRCALKVSECGAREGWRR